MSMVLTCPRWSGEGGEQRGVPPGSRSGLEDAVAVADVELLEHGTDERGDRGARQRFPPGVPLGDHGKVGVVSIGEVGTGDEGVARHRADRVKDAGVAGADRPGGGDGVDHELVEVLGAGGRCRHGHRFSLLGSGFTGSAAGRRPMRAVRCLCGAGRSGRAGCRMFLRGARLEAGGPVRARWSSMPCRASRSAAWSGRGLEGVAGGAPERLDHSGPPVAQRGVGEKAGDLPVKDASGQGALGDAHPLAVAEREARELLRPRVAGGAVAPGGPGLAFWSSSSRCCTR